MPVFKDNDRPKLINNRQDTCNYTTPKQKATRKKVVYEKKVVYLPTITDDYNNLSTTLSVATHA